MLFYKRTKTIVHDNMPTNHWNRRMKTLHKRIKNADISEENRELLWEFKRALEVQDYSKGRIYKLLNYLNYSRLKP